MVTDDFDPEGHTPHLQWATDPSGRRYWIQGAPAFGSNPLTDAIRAAFSKRPTAPEVRGMVTVERVTGDERTDVFMLRCNTLDEARAKAISLAGEIETGNFEEQPPGG